jgi:L-lactate dehydrogenase complex protein LldG
MNSARDTVLGRVRAAVTGNAPVEIPRTYARNRPAENLVELFAERVAEYRAAVEIVPGAQVAQAVEKALRDIGAQRIVLPAGFPENWLTPGSFATVGESADTAELDAVDAVISTATAGIASTGTVVLDHRAGQGRRALTLVPDAHLCVVNKADILDDVPAALARLDPRRPLTFISGPSATSDIELDRVEGVHGPRTLHVLIAQE